MELQKLNKEVQKMSDAKKLKKSEKNIYKVLYYYELMFVSKIIQTTYIN